MYWTKIIVKLAESWLCQIICMFCWLIFIPRIDSQLVRWVVYFCNAVTGRPRLALVLLSVEAAERPLPLASILTVDERIVYMSRPVRVIHLFAVSCKSANKRLPAVRSTTDRLKSEPHKKLVIEFYKKYIVRSFIMCTFRQLLWIEPCGLIWLRIDSEALSPQTLALERCRPVLKCLCTEQQIAVNADTESFPERYSNPRLLC